MIPLSAAAAAMVAGSYQLQVRVESWLDGQLLAEAVPVDDGAEDVDDSLNVPERVTLTVPRVDRGFEWAPGADPAHPLAAFGQRLRVSLGVDIGRGQTEWLQRGWFLIDSVKPASDDSLQVTAVGLLDLVQEARLVSPYQPSGTFVSTLRGLVEPALTAVVDAGLTDRAVPSSLSWDEDRIGGLAELLDAWPAVARVTPDGYLAVTPNTTGGAVLSLTDGLGGTVVRWQAETSREGAYTAVVARGTASDGGVVQGVAYDLTGGPLRYGGPFNPLPVPYLYFSPLITTVAQARAAAVSVLARLRRRTARRLSAELVPHPGLQTGDVVTVTGAGLDAAPCIVDALTLPYSAGAGAETLTLRVL